MPLVDQSLPELVRMHGTVPVKATSVKVDWPSGLQADFVLVWYRAWLKNPREDTVPLVELMFRRLFEDGTLGAFLGRAFALTHLGQMRIGSIWRAGRCFRQLAFERHQFEVNYSAGHWRFSSLSEYEAKAGLSMADPILPIGRADQAPLLEFDLQGGGKLLIPSTEFFTRTYGHSGHVRRVLAVYDWSRAESMLFAAPGERSDPNEWVVRLACKDYNADALFLAHVQHDPVANRAARRVHADLEAQFKAQGNAALPQIGPWFCGPTSLRVEGVALDKQTFVGLRIVGIKEPCGANISFERENPGPALAAADGDAPLSAWRKVLVSQRKPAPLIVNLTSNDAPSISGGTSEVLDAAIEIFGERRRVERKRLAQATTRPGGQREVSHADLHSAGDRHGKGKSVGYASHINTIELEREGAVRDIWNALLELQKLHSKELSDLSWFTHAAGFVAAEHSTPQLESFMPYPDDEAKQLQAEKRSWVYLNVAARQPRGLLIAKIMALGQAVFFFEIERRRYSKKAADANATASSSEPTEQHVSGLVVSPPPNLDPEAWIPLVMQAMRAESGIMKRVLPACPGDRKSDYRRSKAATDKFIGQSTVLGALFKVGVDLPKTGQGG